MSLQEVLPPCEKSSSPPEAVPAQGCTEHTPPLRFDSPVTGTATCQVQTCPQNPAKDGRLFHPVLPRWTVWGSQLMTVLRKPPTSTHLGLCKHRLQRGGFHDLCFCLFQWFQTHDIIFLSLTRVFADLYTVHKIVLGATGIRSGPATSEWVKLLSCVYRLVTPWTIDYQAPPSMEFSRQEYWSGLLFPSPGDLPDPMMEPWSPTLQVDALPSEPPGKSWAGCFGDM